MTKLMISVDPEVAKAVVLTFSGELLTINVDRILFFEGRPERVFGSAGGEHYKFKADEEPFELTFALTLSHLSHPSRSPGDQ